VAVAEAVMGKRNNRRHDQYSDQISDGLSPPFPRAIDLVFGRNGERACLLVHFLLHYRRLFLTSACDADRLLQNII
jgi:hypothetical protein